MMMIMMMVLRPHKDLSQFRIGSAPITQPFYVRILLNRQTGC